MVYVFVVFAYVEKKVGMQANESEVRANLLQ